VRGEREREREKEREWGIMKGLRKTASVFIFIFFFTFTLASAKFPEFTAFSSA